MKTSSLTLAEGTHTATDRVDTITVEANGACRELRSAIFGLARLPQPLRLMMLALCLSLVSCRAVPTRHDGSGESHNLGVVTRDDMRQILVSNQILMLAEFDSERYLVPSEQWLRKTLPERLSKARFFYGTAGYSVGDNDCKDFVKLARVTATAWNHQSGKPGCSIAFGEVRYRRGTDLHAVNIAVVGDKVEFFEPQTCDVIQLSQTERGSISCVRF